jgi:hypothetical protein
MDPTINGTAVMARLRGQLRFALISFLPLGEEVCA